MFPLGNLGPAAKFESTLIRECKKNGLASARAKGRVAGKPRFRANDPSALCKMRLARQDG